MEPKLLPGLGLNDSDLLDALLRPDLHGDYPQDSRAFIRIDCSLRAYWHAIFDAAPGLLELDAPDGLRLYRAFMRYATEQNLSMNWALYLHLDSWLRRSEWRDGLTLELSETLYNAAAARWAIADRSPACGIVLGSQYSASLTLGWKCMKIDGGREVEQLELESPLPAPDDDAGYFCLQSPELDSFPGWLPIPA